MEKVYLALDLVGLTAEKAKLENDCRESNSAVSTAMVSVVHARQTFVYLYTDRILLTVFVIAAKMQPPGGEKDPADRTGQSPVKESKVSL